jgi:Na+-translocating ferredoxin:NAD+ oxidoreductase RnfA subunit
MCRSLVMKKIGKLSESVVSLSINKVLTFLNFQKSKPSLVFYKRLSLFGFLFLTNCLFIKLVFLAISIPSNYRLINSEPLENR